MTTNPFEARVIELEAQAAALRAEISEAQALTNRLYEQEQSYARRGDYGPLYQQASVLYNAALRNLQTLQANLEAVMSELASAKANRDRIAAAAAEAVAAGLDPKSAMEKAVAEQARAEGIRSFLKYVGIGLLVLLVVIAIIRWRRKK